jgi:putative hemolysin
VNEFFELERALNDSATLYELAQTENDEATLVEVSEMIPALLQSYLKAGAKVAASPALDRDFKCVDFFTVLDMESLTQLYERRYRPD